MTNLKWNEGTLNTAVLLELAHLEDGVLCVGQNLVLVGLEVVHAIWLLQRVVVINSAAIECVEPVKTKNPPSNYCL